MPYIICMGILPLSISKSKDSQAGHLSRGSLEVTYSAVKEEREKNIAICLSECLRKRGRSYVGICNYNLAFWYYIKSVDVSKKVKYLAGAAKGYNNLGTLNFFKGSNYEARYYLLQAEQIYLQLSINTGLIDVYNNLGLVETRIGNLTAAETYLQKAHQLAKDVGEELACADALSNLGILFSRQGFYEKSLALHMQAKEINERSDRHNSLANNYNNIANIYYYANKLDDAQLFYEKALAIREATNEIKGLATALSNLGNIYFKRHNLIIAVNFYTRSLELDMKNKNLGSMSYTYGLLAKCYIVQKNFNKAVAHSKAQIETAKQSGELLSLSDGYFHLAESYLMGQKYGIARAAAQKAIKLANKIKWQEGQKETLLVLYKIEKQTANTTAALTYYEKYVEILSTMAEAEVANKLSEMKFKYDIAAQEKERAAVEGILFNVLPPKIAQRIKNGEAEIVDKYDCCTVLFADIVGFTNWSAGLEVHELAHHLNKIFNAFDELAAHYNVEKIKTIGDAYMCVSGLPEFCRDHASKMANLALALRDKIGQLYPGGGVKLRIGIHTGQVIAGVLGKNKYAFDLWGDTVNTASRMESYGLPDKIQVTEEIKNLLGNTWSFEDRGMINIKGKGIMHTYFLEGRAGIE